jgi:hypothetical protein
MATVEYLLLANHAEVQNGLLYVSGAGWANLYRGSRKPGDPLLISHFGIGASILIPWDETNQRHQLVIRVVKVDSDEELARVEGGMEIGRPPGLESGAEQRVAVALGVDVPFPGEGSYRVVVQVGQDQRSVGFKVLDQPKPPQPRTEQQQQDLGRL